MFTPALANIGTRLITREGWSNLLLWPNFRRGWPFYLAGLFLPALATVVGGAIYYVLFPAQSDPTMTYARQNLGLTPKGSVADVWTFLLIMAPAFSVLSVLNLPLPFGEEFGWRAYLLPKLMPLGGRKAALLIAVIWAVWHWPFIFMGYEYGFGYWGAPVAGPLLWIVICIFLSTLLTWVTLRSGSVWHSARGRNASIRLHSLQADHEHIWERRDFCNCARDAALSLENDPPRVALPRRSHRKGQRLQADSAQRAPQSNRPDRVEHRPAEEAHLPHPREP